MINILFCTLLHIMIRIFFIFNKVFVMKIFTKVCFLNFSAHIPLSPQKHGKLFILDILESALE